MSNSVSYMVYPEYIELLKKVALECQINQEDLSCIMENILINNENDYQNSGNVKYTLKVDDEYPINWEGMTGKVFEIIGPNMRNKTLTLVYTATLLGLDWFSIAPYIDDKKLIAQSEFVKSLLSHGKVKTSLIIENDLYILEIVIENSLANGSLWEKKNHERLMFFERLPLYEEKDWEEYRKKLSCLFDIQVVAKGRNFIAQVGFEEATNFANFCKNVATIISDYNKYLNAQAPKMAPETIDTQINELNKRLKIQVSQRENIRQNIIEVKSKIEYLSKQIIELEKIVSEHKIFELMNLKNKFDSLENLSREINEEKKELESILVLVKNNEESFFYNSNLIASLLELCEELLKKFLGIKENINIPKSILEKIEIVLKDKDIDGFLSFIELFDVDAKTIMAHKELGNYNPPEVSLNTKIIGLKIFDYEVKNLGDFRKRMIECAEDANILYSLNEIFNKIKKVLKSLYIEKRGDYSRIVNDLNDMKQFIDEGKLKIKELEKSINDKQTKFSLSLKPYSSIEDIKEYMDVLENEVNFDNVLKLQELIDLYDLPGDENIVELLHQKVCNLQNEIKDLTEKESDIERQIQSLKFELAQKTKERSNAVSKEEYYIRIKNLSDLYDFLKDSCEYFTHKRLAYEIRNTTGANNEEYLNEAGCNEKNLGERFPLIIQLINERIKNRCPFAFVNIENVQKKNVISFDFLNEDFEVEDLPQGAKRHGGITSCMTVYGLATKKTDSKFGSILLVDEWGDVGVYKNYLFEALEKIPQLAFSIFVDVDENKKECTFEKRR